MALAASTASSMVLTSYACAMIPAVTPKDPRVSIVATPKALAAWAGGLKFKLWDDGGMEARTPGLSYRGCALLVPLCVCFCVCLSLPMELALSSLRAFL
eukprot:CAMPEP_0118665628 /NCGR_PEP_ID=MMETSP0785-20121206/18727_1 /TAXON_ID=91992 /ORGANISM="Bolidomonas pacifica, Strain CCMP 1866" /LENGTH=98 /DNA_ID=CAMNT_0006559773 /DNA_START=33 /DNA_END=329 /DNA_ORIENTATION=+